MEARSSCCKWPKKVQRRGAVERKEKSSLKRFSLQLNKQKQQHNLLSVGSPGLSLLHWEALQITFIVSACIFFFHAFQRAWYGLLLMHPINPERWYTVRESMCQVSSSPVSKMDSSNSKPPNYCHDGHVQVRRHPLAALNIDTQSGHRPSPAPPFPPPPALSSTLFCLLTMLRGAGRTGKLGSI